MEYKRGINAEIFAHLKITIPVQLDKTDYSCQIVRPDSNFTHIHGKHYVRLLFMGKLRIKKFGRYAEGVV